MSVRTESESDGIAFIHSADAQQWAAFLENKLCSDSYKIHTYSQAPELENTLDVVQTSKVSTVLVSPGLLEDHYRSFWSTCLDHFNSRTVILLLGVDATDLSASLGPALSSRVLSHHCLEMDSNQETVTNALVKLIEMYESAECVSHPDFGNSHKNSIAVSEADSDAFHADYDQSLYEDDEVLYDVPPPPRQQNGIALVSPTVLYEHNSLEVLLLLEREAEERLTMVIESGCGPSRHIHLKHISTGAYIAKLPENSYGEINFSLLAGTCNIGRETVHVYSRRDQLHHILTTETDPLTLLCNSLGMQGDKKTAEELDAYLARRLIDANFPADLRSMFKFGGQSTADQEDCHWPTLLHFAAEFNLKQVCEELLKFPGMIHAACLENKEGLFPCQLAEKGGFRNLQRRLVQYVEDARIRRSAADSGISFSENLPPPERHGSSGPYYVNEPEPTTDEDYIDMNLKLSFSGRHKEMLSAFEDDPQDEYIPPPPPACHAKEDDRYAKPRSFSEGCVKTPYARQPCEAKITEEESDGKDSDPPPLKPKLGRAMSVTAEHLFPKLASPLLQRPDSGSSEDSDTRGKELSERTSKSSTETLTCQLGEGREAGGMAGNVSQSDSRPTSHTSASSFESDVDEEAGVQRASSPSDSPVVPVMRGGKRSKSVQDKISNFINKIKKPTRKQHHSSSEGDLPVFAKGSKKSIIYSRGSTASTSSDPLSYLSSSLGSRSVSVAESESERDSGAVCEETGSLVLLRNKSKGNITPRNSGKRNGTSMQRRISVRILRAQKEELGETPNLPSRRRSGPNRETFISHIKDDSVETSASLSALQGQSAGPRESFISHVKM